MARARVVGCAVCGPAGDKGTLVDAINRGDFLQQTRDGQGFKPNYKVGWGGAKGAAVGLPHLPSCKAASPPLHAPLLRRSPMLCLPSPPPPCTPQAIYTTLLEITLALRHIHALGITHCDLKVGGLGGARGSTHRRHGPLAATSSWSMLPWQRGWRPGRQQKAQH